QTGVKIAVLAMDACLMGMIEVAYQVSSYVEYFAASEETVPGYGFPYDRILQDLSQNPETTPEQLAETIVEKYWYFYTNDYPDENVTIAAFSCSHIPDVAEKVSQLAQQLIPIAQTHKPEIEAARDAAQPVYYAFYRDLYGFAEEIKNRIADPSIQDAAQQLMSSLEQARVAEHHGSGRPGAHGLTVYWPLEEEYLPEYENLKFSQDTSWDEFLKAFYGQLELPDLVVSEIAWTPDSPTAGQQVTIQVRIENAGSAASGAFQVECKIDGSTAATWSITGLDAGSSVVKQLTWTATAGQHTIEACADTQNAVTEINEDNNCLSTTLTVTGGELQLQEPYASRIACKKGTTITLRVRVIGSATSVQAVISAGSNTYTVTLYDDGEHDDGAAGDGVYGGYWDTSSAPNGIYSVTFTASGPAGQASLENAIEIRIYEQATIWDVIWIIEKYYNGACSTWDVLRVLEDYYSG
ncbi:MAG: hypothetical protein DRN99_08280, partial [Thermoproteota archaeon]